MGAKNPCILLPQLVPKGFQQNLLGPQYRDLSPPLPLGPTQGQGRRQNHGMGYGWGEHRHRMTDFAIESLTVAKRPAASASFLSFHFFEDGSDRDSRIRRSRDRPADNQIAGPGSDGSGGGRDPFLIAQLRPKGTDARGDKHNLAA